MKTKSCPASYKAWDDEPEAGTFEAIVSVFNNEDMAGDIVRPGAFAKTIAAWKTSPNTMPVLWSHRMDDPAYNIGAVEDIEEVTGGDPRIAAWANPWVKANGGLWIKARLDADTPVAAQVRHLLAKRRVTQFSYAYDVLGSRPGTKSGTTELTDLWVYEVGPTPIGCNAATELLAAKAAEPPDPVPEEPQDSKTEGGRSAAFFRLRAEIAAMAYAHSD